MLTDNIQVHFPVKLGYIYMFVRWGQYRNIGIHSGHLCNPPISWLLYFISKLHNNCWNSRHCIYWGEQRTKQWRNISLECNTYAMPYSSSQPSLHNDLIDITTFLIFLVFVECKNNPFSFFLFVCICIYLFMCILTMIGVRLSLLQESNKTLINIDLKDTFLAG